MGQKLTNIGTKKSKSELGYISTLTRYQAQNCQGCPLRGLCHKSKSDRVIEVNYKLQEYKRKARERLLSEQGVYHRGKRCIEPEAVFAQVKHNSQFNRFRLRGLQKVNVEFTLVAIAHNLRKWSRKAAFSASSLVYALCFTLLQKRESKKLNLVPFQIDA